MDTINISITQAIFYFSLINAILGFVLGLIPLLLGHFYKQLRLGVWGIVSGTVGGAVLGVFLSVPAVIIFTWLIVRASRRAAGSNSGTSLESSDKE